MTQVPLQGIGMRGLNQDTPSFAQDHTTFNSGINLRPLNGSLQGVYAFPTTRATNVVPSSGIRNIYGMTQWTQTTGDANDVNVAYMYTTTNAGTTSLNFQVVDRLDSGSLNSVGTVATTWNEENMQFGLDVFAFNDLVMVNDGNVQPLVVSRSGENYGSSYMSNWPLGTWENDSTLNYASHSGQVITLSGAVGTIVEVGDRIAFDTGTTPSGTITIFDVTAVSGSTITVVGTIPSTLTTNHNLFVLNQITCQKLTSFNNRLIALNISENYVDGGNATMLWSTPITQLGSLSGVTFVPASTNTAGDDIITETPGQLLDAGQLGNYLIVYKSDSVFAVTDTGDPLYLVSQQIFNDDGILSSDCFVDIGNSKHFVVGTNGIYIHDGGVNKQNVSKGRVEDYFFDRLQNMDRTFVFHHLRDKEVWVCYDANQSSGNTVGVDRALVYNYELDAWHERGLPDNTRGITATNLNGEYNVYAWGRDSAFKLGTGYVHSGMAQFDKHDLGDSTMTKRVHAVYPHTVGDINVALVTTNDIGQTLPAFTNRLFEPVMEYKVDYRLYGRYFDLRLQMEDGTNPELTGITFDITPGGRR